MNTDAIQKRVLPSGLTAIVLPKNDAPVAAVQVWYKTGSANESDSIRGISHMLEHMMFRGSAHFPADVHNRQIASIGGHCNAFTAEDATAFTNAVPADHLDLVLDLEADRMTGLTLDADLFTTERAVIVEEYHTYVNNPVARAFMEFRSVFHAGSPYTISPLGLIGDIERISIDDMRTYYHRRYRPENAVVAVVGNVTSAEDIFERIEQRFPKNGTGIGDGPEPAAAEAIHPSAAQHIRRTVDFDVPMFISGYPAPPSSHKDALSLDIMGMCLTLGETGRLHRELVRKQGLAVMAGGMNHFMRRAGMSIFFAAYTPDVNAKKIDRALAHEVRTLIQHGVVEAEIEKIRNAALTSRIFDTYSAESLCQHLGHAEVIDGDCGVWLRRLDELNAIKASDIEETAAKYWTDENRFVLELTPARVNPLLFAAGIMRRITGGRS